MSNAQKRTVQFRKQRAMWNSTYYISGRNWQCAKAHNASLKNVQCPKVYNTVLKTMCNVKKKGMQCEKAKNTVFETTCKLQLCAKEHNTFLEEIGNALSENIS